MTKQLDFLLKRRSVLALMLDEPGPSAGEVERILTAGSRVPDHGKLVPWRFVVFEGVARAQIGEMLAAEFVKENPNASAEQIETERLSFMRAPLVIGVISTAAPHAKIPEWEQQLTSGAVCQNLLHAAGALGYSAQWLTQWIAYNEVIRQKIGVKSTENVAGFIYIGTAKAPPSERPRPDIGEITHNWTDSTVN